MAASKQGINLSEFFVPSADQRLRTYFGRVIAGQPREYRTGFYHGKTTSKVLANWMDILESISKDYPGLWEFENDLAKKVGPLSVMKPLAERLDDIESYYSLSSKESAPILKQALDSTCKDWSSCIGLHVRSQLRTLEEMKKSTSSGNPFFTRKRRVMNETVPFSLSSHGLDTIQHLPDQLNMKSTAILGWRGQEGGPKLSDVKQRVVWMFPFAINVAELQMYQPLILAAQRNKVVPAWISQEAVESSITRLFDTKGPKDLVICTDFTKFDQHFNSSLQDGAKYILEYLTVPGIPESSWLEQVFPIKYNIPLMIDMNTILYGPHGMGSGSGGTNADETLAHKALQHESALLNDTVLNPYSMCLGDDGILSYPNINIDKVVSSYTMHGLEMNHEKQSASYDECTYLRRWYSAKYRKGGTCVGVYSTCRAIGRLCEQERLYPADEWGPTAIVLRELSILENCKHHPLREQFVDYCMKGDKSKLGLAIPGFFDNIVKSAQKLTAYMPDFLGYTRSQMASESNPAGIKDWWIVNYLKSLA